MKRMQLKRNVLYDFHRLNLSGSADSADTAPPKFSVTAVSRRCFVWTFAFLAALKLKFVDPPPTGEEDGDLNDGE